MDIFTAFFQIRGGFCIPQFYNLEDIPVRAVVAQQPRGFTNPAFQGVMEPRRADASAQAGPPAEPTSANISTNLNQTQRPDLEETKEENPLRSIMKFEEPIARP